MAYDLLIKDGRIVDGSGMAAFRGDVGVRNGKIVELGKLSGPADRTPDAAGNVIATVRFAARPALAEHTMAAIDVAVDREDPDNRVTRHAYPRVGARADASERSTQ